MSHLHIHDLLKYPLVDSIMNDTKSNVIVLQFFFFGGGGSLQISNLKLGFHHLPYLSID